MLAKNLNTIGVPFQREVLINGKVIQVIEENLNLPNPEKVREAIQIGFYDFLKNKGWFSTPPAAIETF